MVNPIFVSFCEKILNFLSSFAKEWVFSFIMEEPTPRAVFAQMQRHVVLPADAA
jgi:hypothetical protein